MLMYFRIWLRTCKRRYVSNCIPIESVVDYLKKIEGTEEYISYLNSVARDANSCLYIWKNHPELLNNLGPYGNIRRKIIICAIGNYTFQDIVEHYKKGIQSLSDLTDIKPSMEFIDVANTLMKRINRLIKVMPDADKHHANRICEALRKIACIEFTNSRHLNPWNNGITYAEEDEEEREDEEETEDEDD